MFTGDLQDMVLDQRRSPRSAFTARHYRMAAMLLRGFLNQASHRGYATATLEAMAIGIADMFYADSSRFDRARFYKDVGM